MHSSSLLRRNSGPVYGLTHGHQVFIDYKDVDRLMTKEYKALDVFHAGWSLVIKVFGGTDSEEVHLKLRQCVRKLFRPVEAVFLNEAGATAAIESADVPGKMVHLVSVSADPEARRRRWERSANVTAASPTAAEADLDTLIKNFGACVAIPLLYGHDFVERYDTLLEDFWLFDRAVFPLRIVGVPTWFPLPSFRAGLKARARLNREMAALYRRMDQYVRGDKVDFDADMSDISSIARERVRIYSEVGLDVRHMGEIDFSLLWGQNANSQQMVFWFVAYIYSVPDLLHDLRQEIAEHVQVSASKDGTPPRITKFDLPALMSSCPLFKASLYETYRMANDPTSIRYVTAPLTVSDAADRPFTLKAGSWISAPHAARHYDPELFPDPHTFVPTRFLERDAETGKMVARYAGRLKPWGSGHGICKGRSLAEREIVAIAACMMSLWDMEPVGTGGVWKLPGMRPGTGVASPVEDLRVLLKRRAVV